MEKEGAVCKLRLRTEPFNFTPRSLLGHADFVKRRICHPFVRKEEKSFCIRANTPSFVFEDECVRTFLSLFSSQSLSHNVSHRLPLFLSLSLSLFGAFRTRKCFDKFVHDGHGMAISVFSCFMQRRDVNFVLMR
jgi:hypothetical protein